MECYRCPYQCLCQDFLMDMNCEDALNYTKEENSKMRLTKHGGHYCDDCGSIRDEYCRCDKEIEMYDKLADYEDAEEQGLIVRLPCKVGDTFYYIAGTLRGNEYVASDAVAAIEISDTGPWIIDSCGCYHIEFWFTREAAEAALKGEKDDI